MRKYVLLLLSLYLLAACSAPTDSQSLEPPVPPTVTATPEPTLTPTYLPLTPVAMGTPVPETNGDITADNVDRLTHIATWGDGNSNGAQYTPDGKFLVVASTTGIFLYETENYSVVNFIETKDQVSDVAISLDNEWFAVHTVERVIVFSLQDFREHISIDVKVRSISFTPDSKTLVTSINNSSGAYFKYWRVSDGELIKEIEGVDDLLWEIEFSPDGKRFATAGFSTRIWDLDSGLVDQQGPYVSGGFTFSLSFTPDGLHLIEGSDDKAIHIWSFSDQGELIGVRNIETESYGVYSIDVSPDGNSFVGATLGGIYIWEVDSGNIIQSFETGDLATRTLDWSPDGQEIVSVSWEAGTEIWDLATGKLIYTLSEITGQPTSLSWSSDNSILGLGVRESRVYLLEIKDGKVGDVLKDTGTVTSLQFSPDGAFLVVGLESDQFRVIDTEGNLERNLIGALGYGRTYVDFSLDGSYLISNMNGDHYAVESIQVWDAINWTRLEIWELGEDLIVSNLDISPDGKLAAYTTLYKNSIEILDLTSGESLHTLRFLDTAGVPYSRSISFSADGEFIAGYYAHRRDNEDLKVWDVDSGELLYEVEFKSSERKGLIFSYPQSLTWSNNGDLLAIGFPDGSIDIFEAMTGEILTKLSGHTMWVTSLVFSPDGQMLASGSLDGTVRLWGLK